MFGLFDQEFFPYATVYEPPGNLSMDSLEAKQELETLFDYRQTCAVKATAQRIGFNVLTSVADLDSSPQDPLGTVIQPCAWLGNAKDGIEMPYFLWDIRHMKAVESSGIGELVAYTCISHTWGRWRTEQSCNLPGVPWAVPMNSRFDVSTLPLVFKSRVWRTNYIWFDLFCIPQDRSQRALQEIGRQAAIFRGSTNGIIWFSEMESWKGLQSAIQWLAVMYLKLTNSNPQMANSVLETLAVHAAAPIQMVDHILQQGVPSRRFLRETATVRERMFYRWRVQGLPNEVSEYAPWFSSLWTLQESCICPSFSLADKHWNLVANADGRPFTLDNIISLVEEVLRRWEGPFDITDKDFSNPARYERDQSTRKANAERSAPTDTWPVGPQQLKFLNRRPKVDNLLDLTRINVLIMANLRMCTESRAEAIMSVLGVTDWYTKRLKRTGSVPIEEDMVLNTFPLAFVREAALKIGGPFFYVNRSVPTKVPRYLSLLMGQSFGSMLPFSDGLNRGSITSMTNSAEVYEDHESVKSFLVRRDGSVRIRRAGIVSFSVTQSSLEIPATIVLNEGEKVFLLDVELSSWLQERPSKQSWFAVALIRSTAYLRGVILKGYRIWPSKRLHLMRTGTFAARKTTFPQSQKVDWVVF